MPWLPECGSRSWSFTPTEGAGRKRDPKDPSGIKAFSSLHREHQTAASSVPATLATTSKLSPFQSTYHQYRTLIRRHYKRQPHSDHSTPQYDQIHYKHRPPTTTAAPSNNAPPFFKMAALSFKKGRLIVALLFVPSLCLAALVPRTEPNRGIHRRAREDAISKSKSFLYRLIRA